MKNKVVFWLAIIWSGVAIALLIVGADAGEARWTSTLLMSFWGFPSSLLIPRWLSPIATELNIDFFRTDGSFPMFFLDWLFLFVLGFFQWFVLPIILFRLHKKIKETMGLSI